MEGLVPAEGVYCGYVGCGGKDYRAAISVGTNPTVRPRGREVKVEAHILDGFSSPLYGCAASVKFLEFLRPQRSFPSLSALEEAVRQDAAESARRVPRV